MLNLKVNRSYVSLQLGNKLTHYQHKKDEPYSLIMANGKPVNHDNE